MATTITKAEFDALPESLKGKFTADGDNWSLVEEDVEGLKKSKAEILAEKKAMAEKLAALEKFKSEFEASKSADEEAKQREAGQFAELEKKLRDRITELETTHQTERDKLMTTIKRERLMNELTANGVIADRARYALADIENRIDLEATENGFALKVKDGIGDANDFNKLLDGMKAQSPFFFKADMAAGSGASGNGGGGNVAKTWTRAQWDKAGTAERVAFSSEGGRITD